MKFQILNFKFIFNYVDSTLGSGSGRVYLIERPITDIKLFKELEITCKSAITSIDPFS